MSESSGVATVAGERPGTTAQSRLLFIDNIRWLLIVVVICHHAAVTYSHVGGWYFLNPTKPSLPLALSLASLETFDQAYFMGFLFLIAGYFVPRAFDVKGPGRFLRDRGLRLGVPSLLFMLVIHPFIVYWMLRTFDNPEIPSLSAAYPRFILTGRFLSASGPMWFAVALLIFCIVYAVIRQIKPIRVVTGELPLPRHRHVVALLLVMGFCTFLVRIVQPIGVNILNMQLCYFSQYILLFWVGILAYRGNWLLRIPRQFGLLWMKLTVSLGPLAWVVLLFTSGAAKGNAASLLGGFHWQSAAFSFWEAFFCLGMCLGLTVLFRDGYNVQGRFARWMSCNGFTAYFLHPPLLVGVCLALKTLAVPVALKFLIACALSVPLTFAVSDLVRPRIPGLRRIL